MLRACIILLSVLSSALAASAADSVAIGRVPYANVTVTDCREGHLTFTAGKTVTKPLSEITSITLAGRDQFNDAEKLRQSEPAKAAALYEAAYGAVSKGWERKLTQYRMLDALGRAGMTRAWVEQWASLLTIPEESAVVASLRPEKLGDESDVSAAVVHLESKAKTVRDDHLVKAIRELVGFLKKDAPAEPGNAGDQKSTAADAVAEAVGLSISQSQGVLRSVGDMIRAGKFEVAIKELDSKLDKLTARDLPRGLYLAGCARQENPSRDATMLKQAGLFFMMAAEFYPTNQDAAESLFRAGRVNEDLGDVSGAGGAYLAVCKRYPNSPFVKQATERLNQLNQPATQPANGKTESPAAKGG